MGSMGWLGRLWIRHYPHNYIYCIHVCFPPLPAYPIEAVNGLIDLRISVSAPAIATLSFGCGISWPTTFCVRPIYTR